MPPSKTRFLTACLALLLLLSACTPSVGEQTRIAATAIKSTVTKTPTPNPTPPPPPIPPPDLGVDPHDLDGLDILFWHSWSGPAGEALESLVAEFNASNEWGIKVQSVYQGNYDDLGAALDSAD